MFINPQITVKIKSLVQNGSQLFSVVLSCSCIRVCCHSHQKSVNPFTGTEEEEGKGLHLDYWACVTEDESR